MQGVTDQTSAVARTALFSALRLEPLHRRDQMQLEQLFEEVCLLQRTGCSARKRQRVEAIPADPNAASSSTAMSLAAAPPQPADADEEEPDDGSNYEVPLVELEADLDAYPFDEADDGEPFDYDLFLNS